MFDDFDTQIQVEEYIETNDFWGLLAEMISSLPEEDQKEILSEFLKEE